MPPAKLNHHRSLITIAVLIFLIAGTTVATFFARGYRFNPTKSLTSIHGTGLLSATSYPKSAQVFIDDLLVTATEDTLNLAPGEYTVRIVKEGFLPWTKKLTINAELVTPTDARLFPAAPSLSALTYSGAYNPAPSPDGKRLAYIVTNSDDKSKNGLYVTDISNPIISLNRTPNLIAVSTERFDLTKATFAWSPDSKNILIAFTKDNEDNTSITNSFLISADTTSNLNTSPDATLRLPIIFSDWEQLLLRDQQANLKQLPTPILDLLTSSAENVYFSPSGEKVIYTSKIDTTIPDKLTPPLASINSTPQNRNLKAGYRYIYDLKEDTNYEIAQTSTSNTTFTPKVIITSPTGSASDSTATLSAANQAVAYDQLQKDRSPIETIRAFKAHYTPFYTNTPLWYPTSRHLISTTDNKITIFEYDNLNQTVVYSGPFDPSFIFPSPSGDRLIILTNLNQPARSASDSADSSTNTQPLNLYTLDLK